MIVDHWNCATHGDQVTYRLRYGRRVCEAEQGDCARPLARVVNGHTIRGSYLNIPVRIRVEDMDDVSLQTPPSGLWTSPFDDDLETGIYIVAFEDRPDASHIVVYGRRTSTQVEYRPETTVCGQDPPYVEPTSYRREYACPACNDGLAHAIDESRKALGATGFLD